MQALYVKLCKRFGNLNFICKKEPKVSKTLINSLKILKWDMTPKQIVTFSRFALLASFSIFAFLSTVAVFLNFNPVYLVISTVVIPLLLAHLTTDYPKAQAKMRILSALGEAPRTLLFLIVPLKQNPNLEEAMRFAVEYGEGDVADDFRDALWKSWSGKAASVKEELPKIGLKWGKYSPEFKRSLYLVRASLTEKLESRRLASLDKSLKAALEGMISKTRAYVSALFIPTLLLFSLGTILPLMFISLLPIMSFFGMQLSSPLEVTFILAATLIALYIYSNKIISERPPSFSQPKVPELEELPKKGEIQLFKRRVPASAFVFCLAILIGFPGIIFLLTQHSIITIPSTTFFGAFLSQVNTLTLIWGVGLALAIYCYASAKPKKKIRDEIKEMDDEILDITYQVANRMAEGRSPEDALQFASDFLPETRMGKIFSETARMIRRRNLTLEQAFFDEKIGTLKGVYSRTVRSMLRLFTTSIKKGVKTASEILFVMVDHLSELKKTEKELQNMIQKSISMLRATVLFFAPFVCGIVVTLYGVIQSAILSAQQQMATLGYQEAFLSNLILIKSSAMSVEILQLIVGVYMLLLGIILIRYISLIESGPDEVGMKLEMAKALPIALAIFTIVLLVSRALLGGSV